MFYENFPQKILRPSVDYQALNLCQQLSDIVHDEEEHTPEEMEKIKFSIKQLIRKLHIVEPVEHVMSIIGKK